MYRQHMISDRQLADARHVALRPAPVPNYARYFVDWIKPDANQKYAGSKGITLVDTTLDSRLQNAAASACERVVSREAAKFGVSQCAMVVEKKGAVLAMVGGRDFSKSQYNRVTEARRQPGSLAKLFTYTAALRAGYTPPLNGWIVLRVIDRTGAEGAQE
jgi:membrane peptidoglycan carboxypeptidase